MYLKYFLLDIPELILKVQRHLKFHCQKGVVISVIRYDSDLEILVIKVML